MNCCSSRFGVRSAAVRYIEDFGKYPMHYSDCVRRYRPRKDYDCVSRFFVPKLSVNEDPVTGSVHCIITPYWIKRLGKSSLKAYQASKRGGEMPCELRDNRVIISGRAVIFAVSELRIG